MRPSLSVLLPAARAVVLGGVVSIGISLLLFRLTNLSSWLGPPAAAFVEEVGKLAALLAGSLFTPAAAAAWVLALWRIAADLNWANGFAIPTGLFSHWQVWLAAGLLLQLCSRILYRYGKGGDIAPS